MARTDKDRPYWVRVRESGIIDHDHRFGVCIIGDRWGAFRHHYSRCKKRIRVEFGCHPEKVNGRREIVLERDDVQHVRNNSRNCWAWVCDCPRTQLTAYSFVYDDGSWMHGRYCEHRYFNECLGHWGYVYDDSIPCSCDDRPPRPTCFPTESAAERYSMFGGGGVPSWFVHEVYHGPERRRERETLRDLTREYNAHGDLEDGDYFNRQAKGSARWIWL